MKARRAEPFYLDGDGKPCDEGLHQLEPADPEGYRLAGIRAARSIGIPEDVIFRIYGPGPVPGGPATGSP